MRLLGMSILALAIYSVNLMAVPAPAYPKQAQPTKEQLDATKEAYAKHGAEYQNHGPPSFKMPRKTSDIDLKDYPTYRSVSV
jgi:hypothetical protein